MFSLADGKLIPMKSDGTDGEPLQTKNSSLTIGTSVLSDWCVSESISDPTTRLAYEISKDNLGRVSTAAFAKKKTCDRFTRRTVKKCASNLLCDS